MFARAVWLLSLLDLFLGFSENEFTVVSTTKKPFESLQTSELRQVTICTIDEKITHRLDNLESSNNGIQHKLEILESKSHQNTTEKRLDEIEHRLQTELKSLHNSNQKKLVEIDNRLDKIESRSKQIFQMLETMNSTFLQLTSYHNNTVLPKNCREVQRQGNNISKVYRIKPDLSPTAIEVLCDMERRGGGWTYILKRFDGSQEFNLNWNDFKIGFGRLIGEFWLGLEIIHHMTESDDSELLVELVDWDNKEVYAFYDRFLIGSENEGYSLKRLGKYEGNAGDCLTYSANMKFTTKDKDQDESGGSCAHTYGGAWWYRGCMESLLTGKYYKENIANVATGTGLYWNCFHTATYSLKEVRMMIKSK